MLISDGPAASGCSGNGFPGRPNVCCSGRRSETGGARALGQKQHPSGPTQPLGYVAPGERPAGPAVGLSVPASAPRRTETSRAPDPSGVAGGAPCPCARGRGGPWHACSAHPCRPSAPCHVDETSSRGARLQPPVAGAIAPGTMLLRPPPAAGSTQPHPLVAQSAHCSARPPRASASAPTLDGAAAPGPNGCRVLLVAGPGVPAAALAAQLRSAGYPVAAAAELGGVRPAQARAQTAGKPFQLLLVCAAGPPPAALAALRTSLAALAAPLPVVVVAGEGGAPPPVVSAALRAGAQDVLEAPLSAKEVASIWKHACKASQHPRTAVASPMHDSPGTNPLSSDLAAFHAETSSSFDATMAGRKLPLDGPEDRTPNAGYAVPHTSLVTTVRAGNCQPLKQPLVRWLCGLARQGESALPQGLSTFYQLVLYVDKCHRQTGKAMGMPLLKSIFVSREGQLAICPCQVDAKPVSRQLELFVAPEGSVASTAADIYTLGCLLFVMHHPIARGEDMMDVMSELRSRILPDLLLDSSPVVATLILRLLHPKPERRPSAAQVAVSPVFDTARQASPDSCDRVPEETTAGTPVVHHQDLERAEVVTDLVYDFLLAMHESFRQSHEANRQQMAVMEHDLGAVLKTIEQLHIERQNVEAESGGLRKRRRTDLDVAADIPLYTAVGDLLNPPAKGKDSAVVNQSDHDMYSCLEAEDHFPDASSAQDDDDCSEATARSNPASMRSETDIVSDKWARLGNQLPVMQTLYLKRLREQRNEEQPGAVSPSPPSPVSDTEGVTTTIPKHLMRFSQDLNNFSRYGRLEHHASLIQADGSNASNQMICSMAFGCNDEMFATAGTVTKKIKVYQVQPLLQHRAAGHQQRRSSAAHYPVLELEAQEKLSSIAWNQYMRNYLISADHGGSLHLWDTSKGEVITSFSEHSNRRVWSADFSPLDPRRMLSAGEDGNLRLWSVSEPCSTSSLCAPAPAYSAQFSPTNANHVALGCANYRGYIYDLRNTSVPLVELAGHRKAVSYVRFMGGDQLVTASIDSTVQLWDVAKAYKGGQPSTSCIFRSHVNEKRFVGLAVREDGYILCGSENNQVCCYYSGLPVPILRHEFQEPITGAGRCSAASAVAWSGTSNLFLAGNTSGSVDLMEMTTC